MKINVKGTAVALITPFTSSGEVDYFALTQLVNDLIINGVDYLVALGTTSEAATLNEQERHAVVQCIIDANQKRVPIVLGMGGNNTALLLQQIQATSFDGVDAILSVVPYYNKPNQEGIYQHFKAVAATSPVPVILYNVPGRTAKNMSAATCLRLAHDVQNIIAVKEASGDLEQVMEIVKAKPADFVVLSGEDLLTFPMITIGVEGVISVAAHLFPADFSAMVKAAREGDNEKAKVLHYHQMELMQLIFEDGNPAGVKCALHAQQRCENVLRLPLVAVNKDLKKRINIFIKQY